MYFPTTYYFFVLTKNFQTFTTTTFPLLALEEICSHFVNRYFFLCQLKNSIRPKFLCVYFCLLYNGLNLPAPSLSFPHFFDQPPSENLLYLTQLIIFNLTLGKMKMWMKMLICVYFIMDQSVTQKHLSSYAKKMHKLLRDMTVTDNFAH